MPWGRRPRRPSENVACKRDFPRGVAWPEAYETSAPRRSPGFPGYFEVMRFPLPPAFSAEGSGCLSRQAPARASCPCLEKRMGKMPMPHLLLGGFLQRAGGGGRNAAACRLTGTGFLRHRASFDNRAGLVARFCAGGTAGESEGSNTNNREKSEDRFHNWRNLAKISVCASGANRFP